MELLQQRIKEMTDEFILQQYFHHKEEYKPEAVELLEKELEIRKIDSTNLDSAMKSINLPEIKTYNATDFEKFDHSFSSIDILLAGSILKENNVISYVDHVSDSAIPLENKAAEVFHIKVHKDFITKTHELLDEHFEKKDGRYLLKISSPIERLKAFSFNDIHLSEEEDKPFLSVTLSHDEKREIIKYGKRMVEEIDSIEKESERVIFYYDSIEDVLSMLQKSNTVSLHKSQILAILEVLQIYCDTKDFPVLLEETITNILGFFIS